MNSHGGRAYYFARRVTELNPQVNFFAFDFMNFGQSEGDTRGYWHPLEEQVRQAEAFIGFVLQRYASPPKVFLVGNSLGSPACLEMAFRNNFTYDGVIFLTAAFTNNEEESKILKGLVSGVGYLLPRLTIPIRVHEGLGTKYDLREEFRADPHIVSDIVVPGTVVNAFRSMDQMRPKFSEFNLPFLNIMSGVEKMVGLFGGVDFH